MHKTVYDTVCVCAVLMDPFVVYVRTLRQYLSNEMLTDIIDYIFSRGCQ